MDAVALEPLRLERLRRLQAEREAAAVREELARLRFEQEVAAACRAAGVKGEVRLDLDNGVLHMNGKEG